ncbi:Transcriptional regulatory protein moc3 [Fusarium austroafricanum]|uniref:Transcriptional regulatory protein moc3 n=1 Tax=Fusarium austroafricanum TaxID=2364996 RepID=A0A8H4KQA3_9HYPO|nr:Transcriptional regulatory protein moc3 [Fusarium austroafricanum]
MAVELPTTPTPVSVTEYIISVLRASENTPYIGEPISQLQHSLQCAAQAASTPEIDEATQVAALLHDIGQYAPAKDLRKLTGGEAKSLGGQPTGTSVGRVGHETMGSQFLLALGFSHKVARLVESHVAAKRYLCAVDKDYMNKLSDASKKSLAYQGGPMSEFEKAKFGSDRWCNEMCQLRKWDDEAKVEGLEVRDLESWRIGHSPPPLSSPSMADNYGLQGPVKDPTAERTNQTPFLYQGSTNIDVTACLAKALGDRNDVSLNQDNHHESGNSPLDLISRDIELTTTIDILTLRTQSPYMSEIFLEAVECPGITPFDRVNWQLAKHHFVELAKSCTAVASCITALSVLYNGQVYALSSSGSLSHYQSARNSINELLSDHDAEFELALVAVFLTCVFELIHYGDITPYLKEPGSLFATRVHAWGQDPSSHSELAIRVVTWLKILHSTTYRGGAMGLISDEVARLFPHYSEPLPNVKPPTSLDSEISNHLYEVLSGPIFTFYFHLQTISGEIARLSLYHRSRTKGTDQQEVVERMASVKSRLLALWDSRCATLRQSPKDLRSQLASKTATMILDLIGICEAAYYAELVDINRQLGDPVSKSADSREALHRIREIVDNDGCDADEDRRHINPAYLRPLFLYAIESMDSDESQWAVDKIAQIQNPIYRGEFFSTFAKALSEAQSGKQPNMWGIFEEDCMKLAKISIKPPTHIHLLNNYLNHPKETITTMHFLTIVTSFAAFTSAAAFGPPKEVGVALMTTNGPDKDNSLPQNAPFGVLTHQAGIKIRKIEVTGVYSTVKGVKRPPIDKVVCQMHKDKYATVPASKEFTAKKPALLGSKAVPLGWVLCRVKA